MDNKPTTVQWSLHRFNELTPAQLYAVLALRSEVFVVEQNCVFQDADGRDTQAIHLLGQRQGGNEAVLVAYARAFPAGVTFEEASIGRVVTRPSARGGGLGHDLMTQGIAAVFSTWGAQPIRIGAQAHLKHFYAQHGFVDLNLPYLEDGIAHLEMLRPAQPPNDPSFKGPTL